MHPRSNVTPREALPARLPKGFVIGSHVIDGWFRDGGMAAIHRAHRVDDDRRVALKLQVFASTHDPASCELFEREAEVMRRVAGSRHVVDLLETGTLDDGRRYLVMEWVEGENLEDLLDALRNADQRLPITRACRIGRDVARGLAELHEHGVVHLDLKPANVMVRPGADGRDEIKLVDFGIAADLRATAGDAEPAWGSLVMGSSAYMAPEQLRGCAAKPSCDVYALGVVLFESISGRSVPPQGWMPEALPRLETLRRGVPTALADLVRACLEVDPQRRPASALGVASTLTGIVRALECEGARAGELRAAATPVRTGGTEVVPLPGVPSAAAAVDVPVQTGATEVALTHDEVHVRVAGAIEPEPEPEPEPESESEAATSSVELSEHELASMRQPWRWVLLSAMAGMVAAAIRLGSGSDGASSEGPTRYPVAGHPEKVEPSVIDTWRTPASGAVAAPTGARSTSPLPRPHQASAVRRTRRASKESHEPAASSSPCERRRAEARHAKIERQWPQVLRLSATARCWATAAQRLQRRRLRVEAYAELHEYAECADEGARVRDAEIRKRVAYCRTKLGVRTSP